MFIANPEQPEDYGTIIINDFYPIIDVNDFVAVCRISLGLVTKERIYMALTTSAIWCDNQLLSKKFDCQAQNIDKLIDIPATKIANESSIVHNWRRALYFYANALLIETNTDISATSEGINHVHDKHIIRNDLRANAIEAIRAIYELPRARVRLI